MLLFCFLSFPNRDSVWNLLRARKPSGWIACASHSGPATGRSYSIDYVQMRFGLRGAREGIQTLNLRGLLQERETGHENTRGRPRFIAGNKSRFRGSSPAASSRLRSRKPSLHRLGQVITSNSYTPSDLETVSRKAGLGARCEERLKRAANTQPGRCLNFRYRPLRVSAWLETGRVSEKAYGLYSHGR